MARGSRKRSTRDQASQPPEPVDVVGGVPDHSANPALWKYLVLAGIFVLWVCLLMLCLFAGGP
ncbi:MAG: hypothetical protein AMJ81_00970 [Phycisphaerae bacterium SM23_33]|jgi:hypothetical protein|nr:MAG: hypothetical protein AMJ81_00970 [Phycisphaerae bacterium SM23_33]